MSTNYFVRPDGACKHHCSNWVHLGKFSAAQRFLHRAYRNPKWRGPEAVTWAVVDRPSWLKLLDLGVIYDEYGRAEDPAEFLAYIEKKQNADRASIAYDAGGYDFCGREFS